jgi:hypothetical protein
LASYPDSSSTTVECLIDNNSFGPLPFSGAIDQQHFSHLSGGGHHFRIRQMNGSFFFYSSCILQTLTIKELNLSTIFSRAKNWH